MTCIQPQQMYDHITEFKYDDGGPEYNWSVPASDLVYPIPPTDAKDWLDNEIAKKKGTCIQ